MSKISALPNSWLMVRLSAMGDVTLTTGVLAYLHERYNWTFTVLTRPAFAPLFLHHPAVSDIEYCEPSHMTFWQLLSFFRMLSQKHQDKGLLDLHANLRSRLLAVCWRGCVRRYPKFSRERRLFLRHKTQKDSAILSALNVPQRYALATESSPPSIDLLRPRIWLQPDERAVALDRFTGRDPERPLIALHPYATHQAKAWKAEAWQALAERLHDAGMQSFIMGATGKKQSTLPTMPVDWNFTNSTNLRESCAVLSCADVLVSGDSGPVHLAGGVKTPVVALFGPTSREWGFMPTASDDRVLELRLPCRPCSLHGQSQCREHQKCMDIPVDTVFEAICDISHRKT